MKLQLSLRLVLRRFLLIFLPLLTLASGIAMLFYYLEAKNAKEERFIFETSEVNYVKLQIKTIINDFKMIKSDLAILTCHHKMHKLHESDEFHHKKALAEEFLSFCNEKGIYDQIRLLDEKGKEIVRVNYNSGNPYIVPEDQLQFKGDRYYFKDTFKLDEGEMFVSPFDLNIEGGKIEKPLKPMIRFGTTVFDRYGQKRGIVVLNYLGENLINELKLVSVSAPGHIMLLNSDGYWLRGVKPEDEWGFMYEDRKNVNFGNDFLNAYQLIAVGESGHFYNTNGLFTFMTMYPLLEEWKSTSGSGSAFEKSVKDLQAKEYTWKIVSHVAPDVLSARLGNFTTILFSIYGAVIASIGCGSWFMANLSVRRMIAEEEVKVINESLEQRVVERTEELREKNVELKNEITERKRAENLLREKEQQMRLFMLSTNDSIWNWDMVAGTVERSIGFERAFGYAADETHPGIEWWADRLHPDDKERVWKTFNDAVASGKAFCGYEYRFRCRDGSYAIIEDSFCIIRDGTGEVVRSLGAMRDITERKKAEEQIKASLKEKKALLNEVHHRVKNNLQVISSLLDMSSMQTQNQETIELFRESRNRVESMALIHSQLYESERFDEIDMERHIQELSRNLLKIYSKEKTITLDIKSANVYLPVIQAVPCALVLNELISNSLKHAYRDGQQGIVSISMQQSNDNTILAKVKDNGVGISKEIDIERTKSLGLKLARNIVYKQLNGKMKIVKNKGTEFIIEFKNSKEEA